MCFITIILKPLHSFHLILTHFMYSNYCIPILMKIFIVTPILRHSIFSVWISAHAFFSISEKSLIRHFLKGVMFWNYHLIDQTIRKNHETYDGRGVQQNLNFQNQPQDYVIYFLFFSASIITAVQQQILLKFDMLIRVGGVVYERWPVPRGLNPNFGEQKNWKITIGA